MGKHQSRHTRMWHHHARFGESDAYLLHIDELVDDEIGAGVGQRRIAYGRPDALKRLTQHFIDTEMLIGGISLRV